MAQHLNCDQLEVRVHQRLDQRLPLDSDPLIQQHISFCNDCRELVARHKELNLLLDSSITDLESMDVDVSDSVVISWSHLFPDPKTPAWRFSSIVVITCLLIAIPIALLWFTYQTYQNPQSEAIPPVMERIETTPPRDTPPTDEVDIDSAMNSIHDLLGVADQQMDSLRTYRPTLRLFGVGSIWESLDVTIDYLLRREEPETPVNPPDSNDR